MTRTDKIILKVFFGMVIIFLSLIIIGSILLDIISIIGFIEAFYFVVMFGFSITGILVFYYYYKSGILTTKKVLLWAVKIAAVFALIFASIITFYFIVNVDFPFDPWLDAFTKAIVFIFMFLAMWLVIIIMAIFFIILGFGMIGVLVAIERAVAPELLLHISRITKHTTGSMKQKHRKRYLVYAGIRWLIVIPDVLNTKTLTIRGSKPKNRLPWPNLWKAMMWQILFGTIVLIYISLNPLLLETINFQTLFDFASNVSLFIPFIILPWFIFLRLNAKIEGPIKDFKIYSGIVYRMYRTFITLGTIIIIIRLAFKNVSVLDVILTFPGYYFFFFIIAFALTFIYFNYFENGLVRDVSWRYEKIKD